MGQEGNDGADRRKFASDQTEKEVKRTKFQQGKQLAPLPLDIHRITRGQKHMCSWCKQTDIYAFVQGTTGGNCNRNRCRYITTHDLHGPSSIGFVHSLSPAVRGSILSMWAFSCRTTFSTCTCEITRRNSERQTERVKDRERESGLCVRQMRNELVLQGTHGTLAYVNKHIHHFMHAQTCPISPNVPCTGNSNTNI